MSKRDDNSTADTVVVFTFFDGECGAEKGCFVFEKAVGWKYVDGL